MPEPTDYSVESTPAREDIAQVVQAMREWTKPGCTLSNDDYYWALRLLTRALATLDHLTREASLQGALWELRDAALALAMVTCSFDTDRNTFTAPVEFLDNLREPLNRAASVLRGRALATLEHR